MDVGVDSGLPLARGEKAAIQLGPALLAAAAAASRAPRMRWAGPEKGKEKNPALKTRDGKETGSGVKRRCHRPAHTPFAFDRTRTRTRVHVHHVDPAPHSNQ